jgi:hypothetical protein
MRRVNGFIGVALLVLVFSSASFAQLPGIAFGARIGQNSKNKKDQFAGGQVELSFSNITLAPNVEYYLKPGDVNKRLDINIDGQYSIINLAVFHIFGGGGYVISKQTDLALAKVTKNGFDVQGGAKLGLGPIHAFGLVKYINIKKATSVNFVVGANIGF